VSNELIPKEVLFVTETLEKAGFEAYSVGGCMRDILLGKTPKDWDVTTNATPDDIQKLFENTFYTNSFGTVGIVQETTDETLKVIEVTPYRKEGKYSDARHPDSVAWSKNIHEDLQRRDFTINALAFRPASNESIDDFAGKKDLKAGLLRAVGVPEERFTEDALRILRCLRLAGELGFSIEENTYVAIKKCVPMLEKISKERVRDEFSKILLSQKPIQTLILAHELGVLSFITPEIEEGVGIDQNQAHKYTVFEHNIRALQHAADKNWSLEVRLAALFHDVGKPKARRWSDEKNDWTFHGHDVVGGKMVKKILESLKFPRETVDKVEKLVRWHMFFSDPDKVTLSAVRRIISNVGKENIEALMSLRMCDRIGTGRPKEQPFRLRKYQSMITQALSDPISVGMLKIDGARFMEISRETPGPRIGWVLHALLEEVLDDPVKNTAEYLEQAALKFSGLSDANLKLLGEAGKERKEEEEVESVRQIRKQYFVE